MASFDHSIIRTAVQLDDNHDYKAIMEYCRNTDNWFKRARGEWDESKNIQRKQT